jgi:hypothetical protein
MHHLGLTHAIVIAVAVALATTGLVVAEEALNRRAAQNPSAERETTQVSTPSRRATEGFSPVQRRVFFGELHLHTSLSVDSWTYGTKLLPDDAYRFGQGETVMVPAIQVAKEQGRSGDREVPARRAWPLDFMAVTDHSESVGTLLPLDDPTSSFSTSEDGKKILANPPSAQTMAVAARNGRGTIPPEMKDAERIRDAWGMTVKAANDHYRPGRFTTFIGYEWSASPDGKNLHRNVIFNTDQPPQPFTADESARPEDLWKYLESVRERGIDVIAIPHNGNASGGLMYDWNMSDGRPIDEDYARRRALNEPLTEIVQIKGQSDTLPVLSPNDEYASFEIFDRLLAPTALKGTPPGSYVRDAFGRGLVIQSKTGANPFKYGIVGGSDIHNALSTTDENASAGGQYGIDPSTMLPQGEQAKRALGMQAPDSSGVARPAGSPPPRRIDMLERSGGGLTGVWAEENTRASIFAALKRKETFATSGPRIRVRMFGGWDFTRGMTKNRHWVAQAYARGVPMGGDLPARPSRAGAPWFVVQAFKDATDADIDRIQIIKVWLEGTGYKEHIFDVAVSGRRNASSLTAVWQDPQFEPAKPAVYYARVLQVPTPRWSTLLASKNELPVPADVPAMIQERAWSSPIWFTP